MAESAAHRALELADEAIEFAEELGIRPRQLEAGPTVIDCSPANGGTYEAGLLLAELRHAGNLVLDCRLDRLAERTWPICHGIIERPHAALASTGRPREIAGWEVGGPGIAAATDSFAVVIARGNATMEDEEALEIASALQSEPEQLYIATVSEQSIPGTFDTIAARMADVCRRFEEELTAEITTMFYQVPMPLQSTTDGVERAIECAGEAFLRIHPTLDDVDEAWTQQSTPAAVTCVDKSGAHLTTGSPDFAALFEG